ncbi:UNVERIFIED_CONTAM: hypothetical protein FKN15_067317 [Acipenser sinensis]
MRAAFTCRYVGLRTEGLFRRSATVQAIKEIQKLYNLEGAAQCGLWSVVCRTSDGKTEPRHTRHGTGAQNNKKTEGKNNKENKTQQQNHKQKVLHLGSATPAVASRTVRVSVLLCCFLSYTALGARPNASPLSLSASL